MPTPEQERLDAISNALANLVRRVGAIEDRLSQVERLAGIAPVQPPAPVVPGTAYASPQDPSPLQSATPPSEALPQAPAAKAPFVPPGQTAEPEFAAVRSRGIDETQMGLTWVNRIGVVTLILGVAFFFRYAIDNQWIGETGRVVLGVLAGLACLGGADRLWQKGQQVFAQGISGLGIALLYLSFYAGFGFYHFLPQPVAFLLMVLTTTAACGLAVRYRALPMAVLGFAGGYLTPFLLSTGEDAPWTLFTYVLVLNAGAMWMAHRQRWRTLESLAFVATAAIWMGWFESFSPDAHPEKRLPATLSLVAYFGLFSWSMTPFVTYAAQFGASFGIAATWTGKGAVVLALLFLIAAAGLFVSHARPRPSLSLAAFTAYWLTYALWNESKKAETGVAFAGITAGFLLFSAWLAWRLLVRREEPGYAGYVLLALNGVLYYASSYELLAGQYQAWMGLFAVLLAAAHFGFARILWSRRGRAAGDAPTLLAAGVAAAFVTLAIPIQLTGFSVTIAWATEAAALAWLAGRLDAARLRWASLFVFALAAARFYAADMDAYRDPLQQALLANGRFFAGAALAGALFLGAFWFRQGASAAVAYAAGHIVLLTALLTETHDWVVRTYPAADVTGAFTVASSVLIALHALVMVAIGVGTRTAAHRITGLVLLGLVVVKLYVYDVWELSRLFRTVAFVGLGVLLLATSYLYSRFRPALARFLKDDQVN